MAEFSTGKYIVISNENFYEYIKECVDTLRNNDEILKNGFTGNLKVKRWQKSADLPK